ncbi:exonuclease 1-like isoform X2 [Cannabis sativa]|uniref:exonuclease 1-like isoform X2 n=2 Tax=Cannabis sativa TaxID=3483 RepID=UPI0029CAAB96|nr:exonuclease 1-like isoform X2 [Cannabis sativa]XP_060971333.1 exonuclease 1-like isoform X2 [Cannabis sativa]
MKPYIEPIHIKKYAGKRVGIDAYSWLHKGAYSCSMELCLNSDGEKKLRYIDYFMHRINLLRHHKITPVVVFDGGNVPCKSTTEQDRHRRRISNREIAMAKLKEGNVSAATEFFQLSILGNFSKQDLFPSKCLLPLLNYGINNMSYIVLASISSIFF